MISDILKNAISNALTNLGIAGASFALEHPTDPTVTRTEMTAPTLELLREIDRANDVGTAMAWVSARHKVPRDKTLPTLLPVVRDALRQGVLRVRA